MTIRGLSDFLLLPAFLRKGIMTIEDIATNKNQLIPLIEK